MRTQKPNGLQLVEPVPVDDDLVTELAHIEDLGFAGRLVYYAEQTCYETGETIFVVKRKIVVPKPGIVRGNGKVRAFLGSGPAGPPLRLVT